MSFRVRLLAALALTAVVPVTVFALGARRETGDRLSAEARRRASARAQSVRADLERETESVRRRLRAAADRAAEDPRLRRALRGGEAGREHLLDWAGRAMRAAGLDALQLLDPRGRIVSSGHFRNEWGRRQPGLGPALARAGEPTLVRLRRPEGPFLALASAAPFRVGGRRYHLVGGLSLAERLVPRMDRAGPSAVTVATAPRRDPASGPGDARGTGADVGASEGLVRVGLPVLLPGTDGLGREEATIEVRPAGLPVAGLRRGLGRWLLLTVALSLLAALPAAWWLAGRMSRPLEALARRTRRLELDRLDVDFPTGRSDEIGDLARTLETMTGRLRRGAARLRAAERRAALGDLARQVNHDVRNAVAPLRNVIAHLEEAIEVTGGEAARVLEERGSTLEGGLSYLEELAGRYRDLSSRPEPAPCDIAEVVRRATAGLDHGDRLRVDVDPDLPPGRADPVALRRVVENLTRNALQAVGADGRVRVSVAPAGAGGPAGGTDRRTGDRERLRIDVEDDGPGMEAEELDRAFEAFHSTRDGGTGLGLAIVRRLVHDLDGELSVESEPGRGTCFTVYLPAATDDPGGAGGTPADGGSGGAPEDAGEGRRGGAGLVDEEPGGAR